MIDGTGDVITETLAKYPPIVDGGKGGDGIPEGGWPEAWRGALWAMLDALPGDIRKSVKSIAVDGTSGTALIVDGDSGDPVYPPMLYNEKRDDAVDAIEKIAPAGHTTRSASSALCKLHSWWFECDGGSIVSNKKSAARFSKTTSNPKLLHHADWVAYLLHGEMGVSDHNNALKLGFDPGMGQEGGFPSWITGQPYGQMIPETCVEPGRVVGSVNTSEGLTRFCNDVKVVSGTTDSVAAFAAAKVVSPGECVTSLGSSLALKMISDTRVDDSESGVYSHRLCGKWLVGGASNLGGWLLRSNFSNEELVELTEKLKKEDDDGSSTNTVTDYFPGVLMGFGLSVEQATKALSVDQPQSDVAFLRNILTSVANVEARSYEKLREMGASHAVTKVLTAGGGSKNDHWSAIRSKAMNDVFVDKSENTEASYGTALLARMGHLGLDTYVPEEVDTK